MKSTLYEAAESTLGKQTRSPDRSVESAPKLKPLLYKRNQLYLKYLSTNKEEDRINFSNVRREAKRVTREAKDEWFLKKAEEAQAGRHRGKVVWRWILDIQRGRQGLVLSRSKRSPAENDPPPPNRTVFHCQQEAKTLSCLWNPFKALPCPCVRAECLYSIHVQAREVECPHVVHFSRAGCE